MREIIYLALLLLLAGNPNLSIAREVKIDWLPIEQSSTRKLADLVLESSSLPEEKVDYLYAININIVGDEITKTVRKVQYFPTYNETHSSGNETIYWDREVERLTILEAGAVTSSGQSRRADAKNIRVVDSNSYNTFTDLKEVVIPISGLKDKSISILEYQIKFLRSQLESRWSESFYPAVFSEVKDFQLTVQSTEVKDFTYFNSHAGIKCEELDNKLICKGTNLSAYKTDSNVLWRDELGQIFVGDNQSWDEVIEHNISAFQKSNSQSTEVKAAFANLVKEGMTLDEKIAVLYKFVARDIRYISMSELGHRIIPHSSASVLKNRFGDCKDKSALLFGLLKLVGIDAFPVLVATERRKKNLLVVPSGNYFDHMVICFNKDKRSFCLDATDTNTHWQSVSSWIQDKVSLPLLVGTHPVNIPKAKNRWRLGIWSTLKFSQDAGLFEKQQRIYHGEYAAYLRGKLSGQTVEQREEWAVDNYHDNVSTSVKPGFQFRGISSMESKLNILSETNYDPFLDVKSDLNYQEEDAWLKSELTGTKIKTKHYDAKIAGIEIFSKINFDFSGLWEVSRQPPKLNLDGRFGAMTRKITKKRKNFIEVETRLKIDAQVVEQKDIESFNEFIGLLIRESLMEFSGEAL